MLTSKPFWCVGRLNFQSVQDFLKICSCFFFLFWVIVTTRMKKQAGDCSGWLDKFARFFHSAWSWRHNRNTITEFFYWFLIGSLFPLAYFDLPAMTPINSSFWKTDKRFTISLLYRIDSEEASYKSSSKIWCLYIWSVLTVLLTWRNLQLQLNFSHLIVADSGSNSPIVNGAKRKSFCDCLGNFLVGSMAEH